MKKDPLQRLLVFFLVVLFVCFSFFNAREKSLKLKKKVLDSWWLVIHSFFSISTVQRLPIYLSLYLDSCSLNSLFFSFLPFLFSSFLPVLGYFFSYLCISVFLYLYICKSLLFSLTERSSFLALSRAFSMSRFLSFLNFPYEASTSPPPPRLLLFSTSRSLLISRIVLDWSLDFLRLLFLPFLWAPSLSTAKKKRLFNLYLFFFAFPSFFSGSLFSLLVFFWRKIDFLFLAECVLSWELERLFLWRIFFSLFVLAFSVLPPPSRVLPSSCRLKQTERRRRNSSYLVFLHFRNDDDERDLQPCSSLRCMYTWLIQATMHMYVLGRHTSCSSERERESRRRRTIKTNKIPLERERGETILLSSWDSWLLFLFLDVVSERREWIDSCCLFFRLRGGGEVWYEEVSSLFSLSGVYTAREEEEEERHLCITARLVVRHACQRFFLFIYSKVFLSLSSLLEYHCASSFSLSFSRRTHPSVFSLPLLLSLENVSFLGS